MTDSASTETAGGDSKRIVQVPSILTNSFRAIISEFGDDIIHLNAHGSIETVNSASLDTLKQYGASREQRTHYRFAVDYEQLPGPNGDASNPFTPEVQDRFIEEITAILGQDSMTADPDLVVTQFTIRIRDDRLRAVTPAQSSEFDLYFAADPAEPPVREPTKRLNADRKLYSELGFKIMNLNLRSVTETETKYHQQSDGRYMSWRGPDDIRPRSPTRLAIRINEGILPSPYGTLKPYIVTDDRVLKLSDDAANDIADAPFEGDDTSSADDNP